MFEERHGHTEHSSSFKELALQTKMSNSLEQMGDIVRGQAGILNNLVAQWEQLYPNGRRTNAARFVQQTFGLAPVKLNAVKQEDINLGFEGSLYEADDRKYYITYREAGDILKTEVLIPGILPAFLPVLRSAARDQACRRLQCS